MDRTFDYSFDGPTGVLDPAGGGNTVTLNIRDIEAAGIREILQTPGAALGTWALLDDLLEPTGPGTPFQFKAPLGQAREVKVALSGLLGRFVARAYLEQFLGLSSFLNVRPGLTILSGRHRVILSRKAGAQFRGDLPDWLAFGTMPMNLTIAEAKGSHDPAGPQNSLERAWKQTNRVQVHSRGVRATLKRIAIATRWGAAIGAIREPKIAVRDPIEYGDLEPEKMEAAMVGVARLHVASLLEPLGFSELAYLLRRLVASQNETEETRFRGEAMECLETATRVDERMIEEVHGPNGLLGNVVTTAGPLAERVQLEDVDTLRRLGLKPMVVGVELETIKASISGERAAFDLVRERKRVGTEFARPDSSGSWVINLHSEEG
jgi:hypothetical protein